jgi:hypothetical protein
MSDPNPPNMDEWQRATESYRVRARTDGSEKILTFVAGVHALSAFLFVLAGIGFLPSVTGWVMLGLGAIAGWSGIGGFWLRDVPMAVRVVASAGIVLSGMVTGPGVPFLLNLAALGALGVVARRRRRAAAAEA